ncbi:gluconate 2-dehydrogenase subunit 3 family protein [Sabulicella rubraurantiaca]|uniref:gluconate 2-dehydrogenase subunit 3 family protein n=1 Tax=Sabulicella rubraurantiaca TaxID=2811429 RepID=UPI001A97CAA6|nr:gluconate 2-dehydrogenase subunit 3 family protein [Sabulicella rubraurantiaca]
MSRLDRRGLFRGVAGFGAATALPAAAQPAPQATPPVAAPAAPPAGSVAAWRAGSREVQPVSSWRFLNAPEAAFLDAAVDRIIPPDDQWPGARWAGVVRYIDQSLAGAHGQGARFYAAGPWAPGLPTQGYQLPLNPAQLYRTSLTAILREAEARQLDFARAAPAAQDAFLRAIEAGEVDCGGFRSDVFFETFLANTIEGFLSDPEYGGNRDMVGWRMIGFPGAHAAYLPLYTHHGMKYDEEPLPMGETARHQHTPGQGHGRPQGESRRG